VAPPLAQVTYPNLWNGITLAYDSPPGGIVRSTYTLAPFAQADAIRLRYNAPVTVRSDGTLAIAYTTGEARESAPVAWQEIHGARVVVPVAFVVRGAREVGLALGAHDPQAAVTIDPVLTWTTFLGGGGNDYGLGIALDGNGNVYMAGTSGATWGTPVRPFTAGGDAFVAKLDAGGNLTWNTFLGGGGSDSGYGIAADGSGNVYMAGTSGASWGTPVRPFTGGADAFVAKLDAGGTLIWNTFLGGGESDDGSGIAVGSSGSPYITGDSAATWGAPIRPFTNMRNAFVAKLDTGGNLTWNTFLGGNGGAVGTGIIVDGNGNGYVVGSSEDTWGTPVRPYTDGGDAFAAKLDAGGNLLWNTFLGSPDYDDGKGIAMDVSGNVYVAGSSGDGWGAPISDFAEGGDAFAAKLDPNGNLTWNTFLGGGDLDDGSGIAVDASQNVYVTGESATTWGAPIRPFTRKGEAFAAKLDTDGNLAWNTFLGGSRLDGSKGIVIDGNRNGYVTGSSLASWGVTVRPFTSNSDAFVTKIPAVPSCDQKPDKPSLLRPRDHGKPGGPDVKLEWSNTACAKTYKVVVRQGSATGPLVFLQGGLTQTQALISPLTLGVTYYWRVTAVNRFGKTRSLWFHFTVK
jgi:hypothetical protein